MEYSIFLTADLFHIFTEVGTLNLHYRIEKDQVWIKKEEYFDYGPSRRNISEHQFLLEDSALPEKDILQNFLIEKLDSHFFSEQLTCKESPIFSAEELENINTLAFQERKDREELAKTMYLDKAIVEFCNNAGLNPRHSGGHPSQWLANCPAGNHPLMIAADNGTWGCGYCKKKGEIPELKDWVSEKKK